jgi:outer membrane protein assembly factor BamB
MKHVLRLPLTGLGLLAWSVTAFATDWPQWRGPDRNGVAPDSPPLRTTWSNQAPPLVWTSEPFPGGRYGCYASPVAAGGKVFVRCYDSRKATTGAPAAATAEVRQVETVLCLDAATGKTRWKKALPCEPVPVSDKGDATPCVSGDRLYTVSGNGQLFCLAVSDGRVLWSTNGIGALACASPQLVNGEVLVAGARLAAFDPRTGESLWANSTLPFGCGWATPGIWRSDTRTVLVINTRRFAGVDATTHETLWQRIGDNDGGTEGSLRGVSTPTIVGDRMVVLCRKGLLALKLHAAGGALLWTVPFSDADEGYLSPLVHQGYVYAFANNRGICVSLADGKVAWDAKVASGQCTSPILADGAIFILRGGCEGAGDLVMLKASPAACTILAAARLPDVSLYATPAFSDGRLYLRGRAAVHCYDLAGGTTETKDRVQATGSDGKSGNGDCR